MDQEATPPEYYASDLMLRQYGNERSEGRGVASGRGKRGTDAINAIKVIRYITFLKFSLTPQLYLYYKNSA